MRRKISPLARSAIARGAGIPPRLRVRFAFVVRRSIFRARCALLFSLRAFRGFPFALASPLRPLCAPLRAGGGFASLRSAYFPAFPARTYNAALCAGD